jgi:hypothetical protein
MYLYSARDKYGSINLRGIKMHHFIPLKAFCSPIEPITFGWSCHEFRNEFVATEFVWPGGYMDKLVLPRMLE